VTAFVFGLDDKVSKTGDTSTGTQTLAGSPPINVPGAAIGDVLACDGSGNFTPQAPLGGPAAQYDVLSPVWGAAGDYTTDDTAIIQSAINAAAAAGGGVVLLGQHAVSGTGLTPKSNVTLAGIPGYSKLKNLGVNFAISSSTTVAASNITIRDLLIEGTVNQTVTVPTRARTTSGPGTNTGIYISGSLDVSNAGMPVITNVVIQNVTVQNCSSLPIKIFGVTGRVLVQGCSFYNCMDAGWGYNQEVQCLGNHSLMSADNGFSISRGNNKVVCVGNTAENCCYHGFWLAGFSGAVGPSNFVCTGNVVYGCGESGIYVVDAPKFGVVSGNHINRLYYRGEVAGPTDSDVSGILIRGSSSSPGSPGTSIAYGLQVSNNTITGSADAGITFDGATSVVIGENTIIDPGTHFKADGVTAIASSDLTQNIGIRCDFNSPSTATACVVRGNVVIDQRATPYGNYGVSPVQVAGVLTVGNVMIGLRNSTNLPAPLDQWNEGKLAAGQETVDRRAAATTITMSSGSVRFAYFQAKRTAVVTGIRMVGDGTAAGATPSYVAFGLYTVDGSGNLAQVGVSANTTSTFATLSTAYTLNLTSPVTIQAGQQYAIGALVVTGATAPTTFGVTPLIASEMGQSPALSSVLTGQSTLPASVAVGSLTASNFMIYAVAVGG
jgi:hypothetical protein